MPVVLGGLFIGVLSALPIVQFCNCCCLWIVGGGMLAAYLQQQNQPQSITKMEGARVGLLAGVVAAFVWAGLDLALTPIQLQVAEGFIRNAGDLPPEVQSIFDSARDNPRAGTFFEFFLMLIVGSVMAAVGGVAGAVYFRKDVPPALGGPAVPPPLP